MNSDRHASSDKRPFRPSFRFSLLALFLFVTLVCVLLAWWVQPRQFIVESLFHVSAAEHFLLGKSPSPVVPQEFERLRNTHAQSMRSDLVLMAALRDPQIVALPMLKSQTDHVKWLRDKLEVSPSVDSELLSIGLRCSEASVEDCRRIVDAVSDAYLKEVVYEEDQRRLVERDALARCAEDLEEKLRHRIANLKELSEKSPPDDSEVVIHQLKVDVLSKALQEVLLQLEVLGVNATAPPRVRRIQKAVIRSE